MTADFQACMVDMDGTLVDSMPYWRRAEQAVCGTMGAELPADDGYGLHLIRDPEMVSRRTGQDVEQLWKLYTAHMTEAYDRHIQPRPGAAHFIETLRDRGIPVWLVTGSTMRNAEAVLARTGLLPLFGRVISTQKMPLSKHQPAFFDWLAGEMGTTPGHLLVVEDDVIFSRAAKAAGCIVYGIHDPAHGAREVMADQCDAFADAFDGLPTLP